MQNPQYIKNLDGISMKVTDLESAISQAKQYVAMSKRNDNLNLGHWQHILNELNKLEIPKLETPIDEIIDGVKLPRHVVETRKIFGNSREEKGFIKNDRHQPLYSACSCGKSRGVLLKIDMLKVGESTENSALKKITRVY